MGGCYSSYKKPTVLKVDVNGKISTQENLKPNYTNFKQKKKLEKAKESNTHLKDKRSAIFYLENKTISPSEVKITMNIEPTNLEENILSHEDLFKEIVTCFKNSNYNKCRELLTEFREKHYQKEHDIIQLACISAKLYFQNNQHDKVFEELEEFYKELNEDNLTILINSTRFRGFSSKLFVFLEELYFKYNQNEEILVDLIIAAVGNLDKNNVEKYFLIFLNSNKGEPLNSQNFEKILKAFLYNINFVDFTPVLIEKIKCLFGATSAYYYSLGRYNLRKHNINLAYENFLKIESAMDNNSDYHKNIGKVHIKLGNSEKAISHFRKALKLNLSNYDSALMLGKSFINLGNFEKASKYINFAFKKCPNTETSIKLNYTRGLLEFHQKNYPKALEYFNRCKTLDPLNYKVLHYIALIHLQHSEFSLAEGIFEQILSKHKNYFPSLFELLKLKIILNKTEEVTLLIPIVEANLVETSSFYTMEYAVILMKHNGDYVKSSKYFDNSFIKGKKLVIDQAIEFVEILQSRNEFTKAIRSYQILLKNGYKDYRIFKGLKNVFTSLKCFDEGIKTLETYLEFNPSSLEANADIGDIYFLKENYQKAIDYYYKASTLNKPECYTNFNYLKKKIALCKIFLKQHMIACNLLEEYSKIKNEKNLYLLMACLKNLYYDTDNIKEAEKLIEVNNIILIKNHKYRKKLNCFQTIN